MQRIIIIKTIIFATIFCDASLGFCVYENGWLYVNRLANLLFISFPFVFLDCARFRFSEPAVRCPICNHFPIHSFCLGNRVLEEDVLVYFFFVLFRKEVFREKKKVGLCYLFTIFFLRLSNYKRNC